MLMQLSVLLGIMVFALMVSSASATEQIMIHNTTSTSGDGPSVRDGAAKGAQSFFSGSAGFNLTRIELFARKGTSEAAIPYLIIENYTGEPTNDATGTPIKGCTSNTPAFSGAAQIVSFNFSNCQLQSNKEYWMVANTTSPASYIMTIEQSGSDWYPDGNISNWIPSSWTDDTAHDLIMTVWIDNGTAPSGTINILSPENISYYTNAVSLNVTNTTTIHSYWIVINSTNYTYLNPFTDPNTSLILPSGFFNVTVYGNSTNGLIKYSSSQYFTIRAFQILANHTDPYAVETKNSIYNISLYDASGSNVMAANLFINYTSVGYTSLVHSGKYWNFSYTGPPPLLQGNINTTTYDVIWETKINGSFTDSTTVNVTTNQVVERLRILPCAAPFNNNSLSFIAYDEDNTATQLMLNFIGSSFVAYIDSGYRNYSYGVTNNATLNLCIYPGWVTYHLNTSMQYYNNSYAIRNYYSTGDTYSNNSKTITLYDLALTNTTQIQFTIYNIQKVPQAGAVLKVMRYYPSLGAFIMVASGQTGYDGLVTIPMELYQYYQYAIIMGGVVVSTTSSSQLSSTVQNLYISTGNYVSLFNYISSIFGGCTLNNATHILACTALDKSGQMLNAYINVNKIGAANYTTGVCKQSGTGSALTLYCDLSAYSNSTLYYTFTGNFADGTSYTMESGYIDWASSIWQLGGLGVFLALILVVTLFFAGMSSGPEVAIALAAIGLVVSSVILLSIGWQPILGLILVGILILYLAGG